MEEELRMTSMEMTKEMMRFSDPWMVSFRVSVSIFMGFFPLIGIWEEEILSFFRRTYYLCVGGGRGKWKLYDF